MGHSSTKTAATFPAEHAAQPAVPRLGQSLLERIGNTPLLRFDSLTAHLPGVTLLGKAEWHNPGGSVKDRAAASIVAEGRRSGKFVAGKTLLDAIKAGSSEGMQHFDGEIAQLVRDRAVDLEVGLSHASNSMVLGQELAR